MKSNNQKVITKEMKTISITRLCKAAGYTKNREVFFKRLELQGFNDDSIRILWKMYKLLTMTDFTPKKIREVFKRDTKYSQVAEKYNITIGALKNEVHNFSRRLLDFFKIDVFETLSKGNNIDKEMLNTIEIIIDDLLNQHNLVETSLEDLFSVKIFDKAKGVYNSSFEDITDEDFINLRSKLVHFSIPSQKFILNNMDNNLINYGVYLLTTPYENLSERDKIRRNQLIKFTKTEEFFFKED